MARITVEDCLEQIPNRFSLVLVAAERTKQLLKGSGQLIDDDRTNKEVVTALREIAAGVVRADLTQIDENDNLRTYGGASVQESLSPAEVADDLLPPAADALPPSADGDELPPEIDADLPPSADDDAVSADA